MSNRKTHRDITRRAYARIVIKKADAKSRIIEGIATTPTPDRMGDVVEPRGSVFKLPIPLLLYHNSTKPVGEVFEAKVTDEGIAFKARIEQIDEPGTLKDRLDEAWQSAVKGLLKAVSIGFMSVEPPELLRNGGLRFLSWEWFELSLVAIPANVEATIDTIRSLVRKQLAASGRPRTASITKSTTPGVTGHRSKPKPGAGTMAKSTAEKIADYEEKIEGHQARMKALQDEAVSEERELDAEEEEEFDAEEAELKTLQGRLHRLKSAYSNDNSDAEPAPRGTVRAVTTEDGRSPGRAAAARGRETVAAEPAAKIEKGLGFARLVMCFAAAKGDFLNATQIAKQRYPAEDPVNKQLPLIAKAQVAGGTTTDSSWASALAEPTNLVAEFVEYLRPMTIIGKFGANGIPALRRVPFNIKVPVQTSGGAAAWVGEGRAKPLTRFDFTQLTLRFNKVAAIAVITEELLRHSSPSAELVVRNSLAESIIARLDADIVDPAISASADVRPGSFTNGAQTYASLGVTADEVRADIKRLVSFFIANNIPTTSIVLVMRQSQALSLSLMRNALGQKEFPDITMNGGILEGMPVITSQYVPQGVVAAVCADEVYLADDGGVAIDMSREASLEMATDPTNVVSDHASPPVPAETTLVSMFQTNSVAIRAERIITWKRRRTAAVAYQTATGWGNLDTSPPQAAI